MTQTYRTDDLSKWGTGKGSNLTAAEVDVNFWDAIQRIIAVESATASIPAGIDHLTVSGTSFSVVLTNSTTLGPYTLPVAQFRARGAWAPTTAYAVLDTVTVNGGLYLVIFAHTSAGSFSPTANDGAGHDYYSLMIQTPGTSLPTGGAVAQVLQKSTTTNYDVTWGYKLPTSGTTHQVLAKASNTNQDANWVTLDGLYVHFTGSTGSTLVASTVTAAIEEVETNLQALATTVGGISLQFSALTDVELFSPVQGSLLYMDSSNKWTNTSVPSTGMVPRYDGSDWVVVGETSLAITFAQMTDSLTISQRVDSSLPNLGSTISGATTINIGTALSYTATITGTCTLNAANLGNTGQEVTIIFFQFTTTNNIVTFGTHFRSAGTLAMGTTSNKTFIVKFISDGFQWWEISRTTAL